MLQYANYEIAEWTVIQLLHITELFKSGHRRTLKQRRDMNVNILPCNTCSRFGTTNCSDCAYAKKDLYQGEKEMLINIFRQEEQDYFNKQVICPHCGKDTNK